MICLILVMEDGSQKKFGIGDSVQSLIREIEKSHADRIVAMRTTENSIEWEVQFIAADGVPKSNLV